MVAHPDPLFDDTVSNIPLEISDNQSKVLGFWVSSYTYLDISFFADELEETQEAAYGRRRIIVACDQEDAGRVEPSLTYGSHHAGS